MRDEVAQHLALAEEKVEAAVRLLEMGFVRDAASRAYYAMYHGGYALVRTGGHAPRTHRGLASTLAQEYMGEMGLPEELVSSLRRAQSVREMGDYEAALAPHEETARDLIEDARRFLEAVRGILPRDP